MASIFLPQYIIQVMVGTNSGCLSVTKRLAYKTTN